MGINMVRKNKKSGLLRTIALILLLLGIYVLLYKIYIPKINAFGCFDDCFSFVQGYFLDKGKQLYSQVYDNHMPLMAYLSSAIQQYGKPINIYSLVLQHRQVLLIYSFLFNLIIIWRFGIIGFVFTLLFEFSKFYVFGDRFLAEAFIVYPLVYMTGLGLHTFLKKRIWNYDIILASLFTWFVIFMREPYIPLVIFLYGIVMRPFLLKKISIIPLGIIIGLTISLFLLFPIQDFFYNVFIVNMQRGVTNELKNIYSFGLISFFYPVYLLFAGYWTVLRIQLIALTVIAMVSVYVWIRNKKSLTTLLFIFITLGLGNLRANPPGQEFYESFNMINWYGLYIFTIFYVLYEITKDLHKSFIFYSIASLCTFFVLMNPKSFIYQHVDTHTEFITNYGKYLQIGEVIKAITKPTQTLFTDGADELLYWASNMDSSYPYSFYYPVLSGDRYYAARLAMFIQNPPDMYYDFCTPEAPTHPSIPPGSLGLYEQWYSEGKPTCLYMKKSLAAQLTQEQLAKAKEFLYYLPEK